MLKKRIFLLFISFLILGAVKGYSGGPANEIPSTDTDQNFTLFAFYDLRDRESFLQITNTVDLPARIHFQIFDAGNLCNENNFFDDYTGNDTHVYNMRDILTNDGNDSGVVLPEGSYGIVAITTVDPSDDNSLDDGSIVGNFRVLDDLGYEYRTNMIGILSNEQDVATSSLYHFNFNQESGVILSDIVGTFITIDSNDEWNASNVINSFAVLDVDIINNNEVLLSCRDVIFACVKPEDPIVEDLFAETGIITRFEGVNGASVASFEYGINNTITNSKGGELLCPGNTIGEGVVRLRLQGLAAPDSEGFSGEAFPLFIGLNNGNGRGSMDSITEAVQNSSGF